MMYDVYIIYLKFHFPWDDYQISQQLIIVFLAILLMATIFSWSAFVLLDGPSENKISDQKINFFYEISELIKLRDEIRNAL